MIESGRVLQDRYRVERQVGQGGMGAVYIATDERFGSTVAIKETFFTDEKFRKAFEREARLLNSLRHPALPRVSDHFIEGNGQFLVMEYIAGEDLSEQIEHEGHAFAVGDVLDWADQLLDALDYLHSQAMPVVHRDIKPQNLKLTPQGRVVLLDFGLAKGNTTNPDSATAAKSVFGYSRNYASLEQIQGTGTDPRSDLYSLAATLYHLLAGNPPVDALTRAMNVLSDKPDPSMPIEEVRAEIPAPVSNVLARAMSLNANERPETAAEMRSMLKGAADAVDFAAAPTYVERGPETNLFSQKTRIQSEVLPADQPGGEKTVSFPENISRETRLRANVRTADAAARPATEAPKRRGLAIGTALGGVVLLVGAAGAAYWMQPAGVHTPVANANADKTVANLSVTDENSNLAIVSSNSNNDGNLSPTIAPDQSKTDLVTKDDPKPAAGKTPDGTRPATRVEADPVPTVPGPPDPTRDPTVGDRPQPRPDAQTGPSPRDTRTTPVVPPEVWRKMTPLQRKKLRRALELQREQQQNRPPDSNNN
jgi:serine/threonine protein kinase